MPRSPITQATKRARSNAQKEDRRQAILGAAHDFLAAEGYDGVTMNGLAKRAGLAKGTLYLYFKTKEEVFLALYLERLAAWCARVEKTVEGGLDDAALAKSLTGAVRHDPIFLDLAARLTSVIEHNVPKQELITAKRRVAEVYFAMSKHFEQNLQLQPGQGFQLGRPLMALLLGASQMDTGKLAIADDLPDDVSNIIAMSSFDLVFEEGLTLLLAGLRSKRKV